MTFSIGADWLSPEITGDAEEDTLAFLTIQAGAHVFTEGVDLLSQKHIHAPLLSVGVLAGWVRSSWWRLLWESERPGSAWMMAHHMPAAGHGYEWPALTFVPEGPNLYLRSTPSRWTDGRSLLYTSPNLQVSFAREEVEYALWGMLLSVEERLAGADRAEWRDALHALRSEANDPERLLYRKLEAWMGLDEDEDPRTVSLALQSLNAFGREGLEEWACMWSPEGDADPHTLLRMAATSGTSFEPPSSGEAYTSSDLPSYAAWQIGVALARKARTQWDLKDAPVSHKTLTGTLGLTEKSVYAPGVQVPWSYGFAPEADRPAVVLRATSYTANRRFDLARLLGDVLYMGNAHGLAPLTSAKTRRQKVQRAFAAEFLCPGEALTNFIGPTPTPERIAEAAHYFQVSEHVIRNRMEIGAEGFWD